MVNTGKAPFISDDRSMAYDKPDDVVVTDFSDYCEKCNRNVGDLVMHKATFAHQICKSNKRRRGG